MTIKRLLVILALAGLATPSHAASLIIRNATVVTMDAARTVHQDGVVVIDGARIVAVGEASLLEAHEAPRVIDAGGDIVMPGMINLHTHIPMVAFRGIGEYAVEDILFDVMFPLEKALLSRRLIHVASRQAAMELALAGVTTFADMYYHEDEVARATRDVGLRGVLGQTVTGFPVVDAPEPYGGLAYAEAFIRQFKDDPLITPAVAPHAAYTVDKQHLLAAKALADRHGVPILMHLTEFDREKAMVLERHPEMAAGMSVIGYLDSIGFLGPNVTAAHVIYLDEADRAILKARGVGVAHNPRSNAKGAMGIAPAWEMYRDGLDIGLGTDGPMSSNQMDVMTIMGYAASVARLRLSDARVYTPVELVDMATMGGARALDMADRIGSLEAGKLADLIVLDAHAVNMQPNYDVYATIAFAAWPTNVTTTIVHGQVIVEGGAVRTVDLEAHARDWADITAEVGAFARTLDAGVPDWGR